MDAQPSVSIHQVATFHDNTLAASVSILLEYILKLYLKTALSSLAITIQDASSPHVL